MYFDINQLPRMDIDNICWETPDNPRAYAGDDSFQVIHAELAGLDDQDPMELIGSFDTRSNSYSLWLKINRFTSYDTNFTEDWPAFDHMFGREAWQAFVAEKETLAQEELA